MNPFDDDHRFGPLDDEPAGRSPWTPETIGANLFMRHKPIGDWARHGACRDGAVDPVVFDYLDDEAAAQLTPAVKAQRQRTAAAACQACPVRVDCEQDARINGSVGIWGGVLFTDRGKPIDLISALHAGQLNRARAGRGRSKPAAA